MQEQFNDEPDDEISSTLYELCHCKKHWIELFRENIHMTNGFIFVQIDEEKGAFTVCIIIIIIINICECWRIYMWNYARANEEPFDEEDIPHAIDVKCELWIHILNMTRLHLATVSCINQPSSLF